MSTETSIDEKVITSLTPPKLWKVIFLNDDSTPMELVIEILTTIFHHDENKAKEITLEIHNEGSGIAGVYSYEIAEQRGIEATQIARNYGSPLEIKVEQE